jgi:hypothetical protein
MLEEISSITLAPQTWLFDSISQVILPLYITAITFGHLPVLQQLILCEVIVNHLEHLDVEQELLHPCGVIYVHQVRWILAHFTRRQRSLEEKVR